MINPFDYLFYKIYTFLSHLSLGENPITHLAALGFILASNIITICNLVSNGEFSDEFLISCLIILVLLLLPYAIPKRAKKIISKYEKESENSRLIGNTVVTLYVIVSIVSFIMVTKNTYNI